MWRFCGTACVGYAELSAAQTVTGLEGFMTPKAPGYPLVGGRYYPPPRPSLGSFHILWQAAFPCLDTPAFGCKTPAKSCDNITMSTLLPPNKIFPSQQNGLGWLLEKKILKYIDAPSLPQPWLMIKSRFNNQWSFHGSNFNVDPASGIYLKSNRSIIRSMGFSLKKSGHFHYICH